MAVVGHLYSKEFEDGSKDTSIETWFANTVDGPFSETIPRMTDAGSVKRRKFRGDPAKAQTVKSLGCRVHDYFEYVQISIAERRNIARCVAALVVRNPEYLKKLESFHIAEMSPKNMSLDIMKYVYELYEEKIFQSDFIIIKRDAENEFLFSDGGIVAREPWSKTVEYRLTFITQ